MHTSQDIQKQTELFLSNGGNIEVIDPEDIFFCNNTQFKEDYLTNKENTSLIEEDIEELEEILLEYGFYSSNIRHIKIKERSRASRRP